MRIWRDFTALPETARGTVVALGNFDGLHCGHRAVLDAARRLAKELDAPLAVMTFAPHPRRLFHPELPALKIVPLAERMRMLRDAGVEHVFLQRFTRGFAATPAQDFVEASLIKRLQARGVVTGEDFCFGHRRGGNSAMLTEYAASGAFRYRAVQALEMEEKPCSSTRIREALAAGDMALAAELLGHPYYLTGTVIGGDKRGRGWGFPTANLHPGKIFLPKFGIYAAQLSVSHPTEQGEARSGGGSVSDGGKAPFIKKHHAVVSFGIRPMYRLERPLLEAHALDGAPDLYGRKLRVELLHYLRPEEVFADETALREQIAKDCDQARVVLAEISSTLPAASAPSVALP